MGETSTLGGAATETPVTTTPETTGGEETSLAEFVHSFADAD